MDVEFTQIWDEAKAYYLAHLNEQDRLRIESVTDLKTLKGRTQTLQRRYANGRTAHYLNRINPFLAQIRSFSRIINTLVQSHPEVAALVWGSLAFVLELAARHEAALAKMTLFLERLDRSLPRFHDYLAGFGGQTVSERLRTALVQYYAEVIGHLQDAIRFLQVSYWSKSQNRSAKCVCAHSGIVAGAHHLLQAENLILLSKPSRIYDREASARTEKVRELTNWVDSEAIWAKDVAMEQMRREEHAKIIRLLQPSPTSTAAMTTAIPQFRDIPFLRNLSFHHSRSEILTTLSNYLRPAETLSELRQLCILGLGGIGKTQIALEWVYRHLQSYQAVFWVSAETRLKLAESYSRYANALGLVAGEGAQQHDLLREAFKKWLSMCTALERQGKLQQPVKNDIADHATASKDLQGSILIVFDNVDDAPTLEDYWPKDARVSVILTTRNPSVARTYGAKVVEPPLLTPEQSRDFMLRSNPTSAKGRTSEQMAVDHIADRLGHLPLVLELIGSYAASTSSTYEVFLQNYPRFDQDFLFNWNASGMDSARAYQASVNTTWTLKLQDMSQDARLLMNFLAFLDPEGMPLTFFGKVDEKAKLSDRLHVRGMADCPRMYNGPSGEFPNLTVCLTDCFKDRQRFVLTPRNAVESSQFSLDGAVSALLQASLVFKSPEDDCLGCHRIIKQAVLNTMSTDQALEVFNRTIFLINGVFPELNHSLPLFEQWRTCGLYHPHVLALLKVYRQKRQELGLPILLCEVIRRCAWYLFERGSLRESEKMAIQGCEILETSFKTRDHPGYFPVYIRRLTSDLYNIRGSISYEWNRPGHGLEWFSRSSNHRRAVLEDGSGADWDAYHVLIAEANGELARLADGIVDDGDSYIRKVWEDDSKLGNEDIWAANLSNYYWVKGEYENSLRFCRMSHELTLAAHGVDSLRMAIVKFNTGNAHLALKQHHEALQAFEDCLRIRQKKMPTHPYTGYTCHKIGVLVRGRGDLPTSATFLRTAMTILKPTEAHTGAKLRTAHVLADVLNELGELDEAAQLWAEVEQQLPEIDQDLEGAVVDESFFDRFVLYCHR